MSLGTVARWSSRHGAIRALMRQAARSGDQRAQLLGDPDPRSEPFETYERIRGAGRLARGRLLVSSVDYELCREILRSDHFGSAANPERMPAPLRRLYGLLPDPMAVGPADPPSMLAVDPPVHTRYRRLVSKVFTPRAIEALRPRIEQLTDELLDDLGRAGPTVDLVERLAAPLPVVVIAEILGVPVERREELLAWGSAAAPSLDLGLTYRQFSRAEQGIKAFNTYISGHLERLEREPGDDILSQLVKLRSEGEQLTRAELLATAGLLMAAGFETTVNLISNGAVLLARHPEQLALLRADQSLWPNAVEEILRYDSPVQNTGRRALRDTEVCGEPVSAGTIVGVLIGGANRDPAHFADPAVFDVRRPNARDHLAFSAGAHFCLGAALARMEAETVLRKLFERFDDLRLAGQPLRRPTRTLHGYESVPVTLTRQSVPG